MDTNKKPAELLRFSGPETRVADYLSRTPPPSRNARDGDDGDQSA